MNISIIGTGYVGLTTALTFCELGHQIICVDKDKQKLETLRQGMIPIYEPGLEELLWKHMQQGNICFTEDIALAVKETEIIYIAVGTPSAEDGSSDLQYVREVAESIGKYQNEYKIVVNKSTVPLGTGEKVGAWIKKNQKLPLTVDIVSNPEFLREGSALYDALNPDRIIIGSASVTAATIVKNLFKEIDCPKIITDLRTAELIKYASNAFLAMKISFINELSRICDIYEININDVSLGIGMDRRIGPAFLKAGIGWGGSCFPKDVAALIHMSNEVDLSPKILQAVVEVNKEQIEYYIQRLENRIGLVQGKTISILGVAFKPNTDDIRESPSIKVINYLREKGAKLKVYDPIALKNIEALWPDVQYCRDVEEALRESDCLCLLTEWQEFIELDWAKVFTWMRNPLVMDARNVLDVKQLQEIGFQYYGLGRTVTADRKSVV